MPSPSSSSNTSSVPYSFYSYINALIDGEKWGNFTGTYALISYSFPWASGSTATFSGPKGNDNYTTEQEQNATSHFALNGLQQTAAKLAMQEWANVANVSFYQTSDNSTTVGDIRIAWTSKVNDNSWGWAYEPDNYYPSGGDIWINSSNTDASSLDWGKGSYNYQALVHEVGHALGLKHPFEGLYTLPGSTDTRQYSIMAYDDAPNNIFRTIVKDTYGTFYYEYQLIVPSTPMVYDIAAMQYLYGANMHYKTGNDVYTFDPKTPILQTIWDAGGNDTISVSNFSEPCTINLTPGSYSSIRIVSEPVPDGYLPSRTTPTYTGTNNLGIAFGAIIENAIGGSGDDTLIGNSANNNLSGGAGHDWLDGGAGNDTLTGGAGNDIINGGSGLDTATFSGPRAGYTIGHSGSDFTVKAVIASLTNGDGNDTLTNVERLKFTDEYVALDIDGNAGKVYRVYQAAFDRKPDLTGLGYWINDMDHGADLTGIALGFTLSAEFKNLYGNNPSTVTLITNLYHNVLHREPDQAGFNYWQHQLDSGVITRAGVLASFAESTENQAQVIGAIANGIEFTPWLG